MKKRNTMMTAFLAAMLAAAGALALAFTGCSGGGVGNKAPDLAFITVTSPPTKTIYDQNPTTPSLELAGLVVTGTYSDGSTKDVTTTANITGFSTASADPALELTVTVQGLTAAFTVTVVDSTVVGALTSAGNPAAVEALLDDPDTLAAFGSAGEALQASYDGLSVSAQTTAAEIVYALQSGFADANALFEAIDLAIVYAPIEITLTVELAGINGAGNAPALKTELDGSQATFEAFGTDGEDLWAEYDALPTAQQDAVAAAVYDGGAIYPFVFLVLEAVSDAIDALTTIPIPITSASVTGLTAPVTGASPVTTITAGDPSYTVQSIAWNPNDDPFAANTTYTAEIVLQAAASYKFSGTITPIVDAGIVSVPGTISADAAQNTLTFTVTFQPTGAAGLTNQTGFAFSAGTDSKTYGDANPTYTATGGQSGGTVTYAITSGDAATVNPTTGEVTIVKAGTAVITATKAADATYNAAYATLTLTVSPKALTGTAAATNRDYDGTTAVTVTITPSGVVGGDDVAITATGSMADADAGNGIAVTISGIALTGTDAANYTAPPSIGNTTVNITKAAGGTVTTPSGTPSGTSITVTPVSVSGNPEQSTEYAIDTSNTTDPTTWQTGTTFNGLTTGATYYVWARAAASTNYFAGAAVPSAAIEVGKLNQAAFDFSAGTADTKTYGDTGVTYTATGGSGTGGVTYAITSGDAATVNSSTGAVSIVKAGSAVITATKAGDATYNAATATLTLTVNKRTLTASAGATNRAYDGTTAVVVSITPTNKVGSDVVTLTATGSIANANAGTGKTVTISNIALAGTDAANYTAPASIGNTTVNITPASITAVTGLTGLTAPATGNSPTTSATAAGTGIVTTAGVTWTEADDSPFTGNFAASTAYKATVTLTADGNHTFTNTTTIPATISGEVPANETPVGTGAANTLTFTVTFPQTGAGAPVVNNITSASIVGLVAPVTGAAHTTVGAGKTAGATTYTVDTFTVKQGVSSFTGNFAATTVYTADVVLKAAAGNKFSGTITPTTNLPAVTNPVSAVSIGGGDVAQNTLTFTVTFPATGAAGLINQDPLAFSEGTAASKTYGDTGLNYRVPASGAGSGSGTGAVTYEITGGTDVASVDASGNVTILKAGSAEITATKAADATYNAATATLTLTVAKRTLTATAAATNRVYDGTTDVAVTITPTNLVGSDVVTLTATGSLANANAGNVMTVTISNISEPAGAAAANYNKPAGITNIPTVTIAKASISPVVTIGPVTLPATPSPSVAGAGNPGSGIVTYEYSNAAGGPYTTAVPSTLGAYYVKAAVYATLNYEAGTSAEESFTISAVVTYDNQGTTSAVTVTPPASTVGTLPAAPTRIGYDFGGWFTATGGYGQPFNATTTVTTNITVYAKWIQHGTGYVTVGYVGPVDNAVSVVASGPTNYLSHAANQDVTFTAGDNVKWRLNGTTTPTATDTFTVYAGDYAPGEYEVLVIATIGGRDYSSTVYFTVVN